MCHSRPVVVHRAALDLASRLSQNTPPCEGPHVLPVSVSSWFPCVRRCDEQLWYMRQTTAFDPKQTSTTDRYQKGGSYAYPHKNPWYMVAQSQLIETKPVMAYGSRTIAASYTDRKWPIRHLSGSA